MRRRSGFTLVEVLVSMALILFIMSILAAAFGAASQAVSDLKAAGDLAEKLRGATSVLKRDLQADHFTDTQKTSVRLSDPKFWDRLTAPNPVGFFRIFQAQADSNEGADLDNIPSFNQTTTSLHYTIALNGTRRSDFMSASVPNTSPLLSTTDPAFKPTDARYQDSGAYNSQFAEVAVFLAPVGDVTDGANGPPQQLYGLFRRQFLTVPPLWTPPIANTPLNTEAPNYLEVSVRPSSPEVVPPGNLAFNTMQDLSMPVKRFWMHRTNLAGTYLDGNYDIAGNYLGGGQYATMGQSNAGFQAADLLMTDVLSFDVRVLVQAGNLKGSEFEDLYQLTDQVNRKVPGTNNPWYFSFNNTGFAGARVFDTWTNQTDPGPPTYNYSQWATPGSTASIPMFHDNFGNPILIQAIQITLRVWDFKTKKTRQVTFVQQM